MSFSIMAGTRGDGTYSARESGQQLDFGQLARARRDADGTNEPALYDLRLKDRFKRIVILYILFH